MIIVDTEFEDRESLWRRPGCWLVGAVLMTVLLVIMLHPSRHAALETSASALGQGGGGLETRTVAMSFADCNDKIRELGGRLGIAPVNIVETNVMRMVRFVTVDGSVLVTCSAADDTMAVTKSPYQGQ